MRRELLAGGAAVNRSFGRDRRRSLLFPGRLSSIRRPVRIYEMRKQRGVLPAFINRAVQRGCFAFVILQ